MYTGYILYIYWVPAHTIPHPHDWIFVTGAKIGLHLCLSVPKIEEGGGGEGVGERQRGQEEDTILCAHVRLLFS